MLATPLANFYISPPLTANVAVLSSSTGSGRNASYGIIASPSDAAVQNGATRLPQLIANATIEEQAAVTSTPALAATVGGLTLQGKTAPVLRSSSQFLAQILSQALPDEADSLARSFSSQPVVSILDNRVLQLFGQVKYMPSLAGQAIEAKPPAQEAPVQQPAVQTPVSVTVITAVRDAQESLPVPANINIEFKTPGNDNVKPKAKIGFIHSQPTVKTSGTKAYALTNTRNNATILPRVEASTAL